MHVASDQLAKSTERFQMETLNVHGVKRVIPLDSHHFLDYLEVCQCSKKRVHAGPPVLFFLGGANIRRVGLK
jgi:hypothetical protein